MTFIIIQYKGKYIQVIILSLSVVHCTNLLKYGIQYDIGHVIWSYNRVMKNSFMIIPDTSVIDSSGHVKIKS